MASAARHVVLLSSILAACCWFCGCAQHESGPDSQTAKPTSDEHDKEIIERIRRLGSDQASERDQAQRELLDLGDRALPVLARFVKDPDSEIAARCKLLLTTIPVEALVVLVAKDGMASIGGAVVWSPNPKNGYSDFDKALRQHRHTHRMKRNLSEKDGSDLECWVVFRADRQVDFAVLEGFLLRSRIAKMRTRLEFTD